MARNVDFSDILNKQVGSAPAPRPIPEGTYHGEIVGLPAQRVVTTKEGDKPVLTLTLALMEAGDDVDEEALAVLEGFVETGGALLLGLARPTDVERAVVRRFAGALEAIR